MTLLALILVAWAWRLYGLEAQSLWRDEVDTLRFATRPLAQVIGNFTRPGENGPLYFLALRPWLAMVGHSMFALRFPSVLAGVLALPLIFKWGKRFFGPEIALIATLLLAVNPYHVWYSQEAKMYAALVVLILATVWAFAQAVERGQWWRWAIWLGLTTTCMYVHVLSVLVIPLQVAWFGVIRPWRRRWRAFGLALMALIAPYIPLVWWQWKLFANPDFRTGHPFVPLSRLLLTMFSAQLQGIVPAPSAWWLAPAVFLLLAALVLGGAHRQPRQLTLLWWFLPALGVFFISLKSPIFTDRYLIWTLPAFVFLLALGYASVSGQTRLLATLLLAAVVGLQFWAGWRQTSQPIKSDFRAAAAYASPRRQAGDLVLFLIPYIRFTYQYYDPPRLASGEQAYAWAEAPYANRQPDASAVPEQMAKMTAGRAGIWLVASEADFYDRKGLIRAWLDAHGKIIDEAHFTRVDVVHYHMIDQPESSQPP